MQRQWKIQRKLELYRFVYRVVVLADYVMPKPE